MFTWDVWLPLLRVFAIMLGVAFGLVVLSTFVALWGVKRAIHGRVLAVFVGKDRTIHSELVKLQSEKFRYGEGDYLVLHHRIFWTRWPPALPDWMRETVPTLFYIHNQAEPIDPYKSESALTANALRYITDEGMLRQTWKEAREAVGERMAGANITLYLAIASVVLTGVVGFLVYRLSAQVGDVANLVQAIAQTAGVSP